MNMPANNTIKMAIVGMDAFFGECDGLDAFESSIYDGKQHFITLPQTRWLGINEHQELLQQYGLETGTPPQGAYIQDFEIDTLSHKIPPNEVTKINPQHTLLLKVCDRALKDSNIQPNSNVAVIIAAETELSVHQLEQRWNLSWQIKDGVNGAEIPLSPEKISHLETIVQNSIHHPVEIAEYISYVGNTMASRVSSLWNFSGPSFTISAVETATFKALELAEMLLATEEVTAVVVGAVDLAGGVENVLLRSQFGKINTGVNTLSFDQNANGWNVGEGAGAVVLQRQDTALKNKQRIYAVVEALSIGQSPSMAIDSRTISDVCKKAFTQAGIKPEEINYLEVSGSGIPQEDTAEIEGILAAYPYVGNGLHCALGSIKANIGHTFVASGIASLIKTALSLYYKYIPGTPKWSGVKTPQMWEGSPFYVATESRPWFLQKEVKCRISAINSIGCDGSFAHILLSEEIQQEPRPSKYLESRPYHLFPISGDSETSLITALNNLEKTLENGECLSKVASETFSGFQKQSSANYTLSITGRNQKEVLKEINSAKKGITDAFINKKDWATPIGSYFTPKPLGKNGEVAFVYPAAVNTYVGIGRTLFRLFPKAFDDTVIKTLYRRAADVEKLVFPRSLRKLEIRELENLEKKLLDDSLAMLEAEILFTRFITNILTEDFQITPKYMFGYSLGETSMMVAQGIWSDCYKASNTFNSSSLFGDRLSGPKNAVREYWGINKNSPEHEKLWANYVLMTTADQVREVLKTENRVYLTQINTSQEVLIAGEPLACERVISKLGCNAFLAPFDHVIHAPTMESEYPELYRIHNLPAQAISGIICYSAAEYQPIALESETIAHSIAKGLCQQLDFPRLVNRVYEDGAKVFIEAGAGGICSRWIDKVLDKREHITISLNRRGIDDHTSLVKALAKLISHGVKLDLSSLYDLSLDTQQTNKSALKKITLGGKSITDQILQTDHRQLFSKYNQQDLQLFTKDLDVKIINSLQPAYQISPQEIYGKPEKNSVKTIIDDHLNHEEQLNFSQLPCKETPKVTSKQVKHIIPMNDLKIAQYEKFTSNNTKLIKAHSDFLEARKDFSQQMSEIIKMQLACAEKLLIDQEK